MAASRVSLADKVHRQAPFICVCVWTKERLGRVGNIITGRVLEKREINRETPYRRHLTSTLTLFPAPLTPTPTFSHLPYVPTPPHPLFTHTHTHTHTHKHTNIPLTLLLLLHRCPVVEGTTAHSAAVREHDERVRSGEECPMCGRDAELNDLQALGMFQPYTCNGRE